MIVGGTGRGARGAVARALYAVTATPQLFGPAHQLPRVALMHAHFAPDAAYALDLARWLGVPLVATFHGWDVTVRDIWLLREPSLTIARYLLRRRALRRRGAAFIAVSDYIKTRLLALGYPPERVVRLYIGVDVDKFAPVPGPPGERYILSTARHRVQKGIDTLLRAFARIAPRFPDVSLVQVGTGSQTPALHQLAADLGIASRVRFLGAQSHDVVRALTQRATVVALTSQTPPSGQQEALGLVLCEASACGVPVVGTRHGGIPEAIVDGETGYLADERDDRAIAEAIAGLLNDPGRAAEMGRRGRAFVADVFNLRTQTDALERLYDRVRAEWRPR
jgi:glycosyltransferase involved in cell wall biosynthesis